MTLFVLPTWLGAGLVVVKEQHHTASHVYGLARRR